MSRDGPTGGEHAYLGFEGDCYELEAEKGMLTKSGHVSCRDIDKLQRVDHIVSDVVQE